MPLQAKAGSTPAGTLLRSNIELKGSVTQYAYNIEKPKIMCQIIQLIADLLIVRVVAENQIWKKKFFN